MFEVLEPLKNLWKKELIWFPPILREITFELRKGCTKQPFSIFIPKHFEKARRAIPLITVITSTILNCPSWQDIWNGVFQYERLINAVCLLIRYFEYLELDFHMTYWNLIFFDWIYVPNIAQTSTHNCSKCSCIIYFWYFKLQSAKWRLVIT